MNPTVVATELPQHFYYIVGFLIVSNIGAIGSLVMLGFKAVWWASSITAQLADAKASAVRAHIRIDKVEDTTGSK